MFKQTHYIDPRRAKGGPGLSIGRSGRISLNVAFVERYRIKPDRMAARLYWDDKTKKVAVVFTEQALTGAFPVVPVPSSKAVSIVAGQFFRANQLDPKQHAAASYPVEVTQSEQLGIDGRPSEAFVIQLAGAPNA
jgi:hypothetical protein